MNFRSRFKRRDICRGSAAVILKEDGRQKVLNVCSGTKDPYVCAHLLEIQYPPF